MNLKTINNQINQIENLVNEFSDFARMPKPLFRKNNLVDLINSNLIITAYYCCIHAYFSLITVFEHRIT